MYLLAFGFRSLLNSRHPLVLSIFPGPAAYIYLSRNLNRGQIGEVIRSGRGSIDVFKFNSLRRLECRVVTGKPEAIGTPYFLGLWF